MKERIQHIIKAESLTNLQFAQLIDSSPATVTHLLSGRNKPSIEMVANIARAFPHYNLRWLILGEGAIYNKGVNEDIHAGATSQSQVAASNELPFESSESSAATTPVESLTQAFVSKPQQPAVAAECSATKLIVCLPDGTFSEYTRK